MNIFRKAFIETVRQWIFVGTIFICTFLPSILLSAGYVYSGGILFLLEAFCVTYYSIYLDLKNKK